MHRKGIGPKGSDKNNRIILPTFYKVCFCSLCLKIAVWYILKYFLSFYSGKYITTRHEYRYEREQVGKQALSQHYANK